MLKAKQCLWILEEFWLCYSSVFRKYLRESLNSSKHFFLLFREEVEDDDDEMFCCMVDQRKVFSLISSQDHYQRSSPIANLWHATSRIWTCTEPEFRLCWMKLCGSDNHYTTAPLCHGSWLTIHSSTVFQDFHLVFAWTVNQRCPLFIVPVMTCFYLHFFPSQMQIILWQLCEKHRNKLK